MKSLSKLALCLLLAMSLTVSAFAAQVPDSLVAENLNGQQRLVKTYTLSPEVDPERGSHRSCPCNRLTAGSGCGFGCL